MSTSHLALKKSPKPPRPKNLKKNVAMALKGKTILPNPSLDKNVFDLEKTDPETDRCIHCDKVIKIPELRSLHQERCLPKSGTSQQGEEVLSPAYQKPKVKLKQNAIT
jgi:hypothetical protein